MKKQLLAYIDAGATLLMAGAAVTVAVVYLSSPRERTDPPTVTVPAEEWPALVESGARIGPANAGAVVVEFVDFQCPFCGAANILLDSLLFEYPAEVALIVQHFPLRTHEYAIPAAVAAECAREQDRLQKMASALFNDLASYGLKPWRDFATAAGVPDEVAFDRCMERPAESFEAIASGRDLARKYDVVGTPTFLVNGQQYSVDQLRAVVERSLHEGK